VNLILFDEVREVYQLASEDHRHRHIRTVLKARSGDTIRIGVVQGPEGIGTIQSVTPGGTKVSAQWHRKGRDPLPLDVIVGHPRPPVLQRLWRDLATARVRGIHVFAGDLGEPNYLSSSVWEKLDDRLQEGMSQGRHTCKPGVYRYETLDGALEAVVAGAVSPGWHIYGGVDAAAVPLVNYLRNLPEGALISTCVCIGPERGLSLREVRLLEDRRFQAVSLGTSVYRTETAVHGLVVPLTSILCGFSEDHV
jgi:16S rRNA (uracil1498-N3)-methyltransferase